MAHFSNWPVFKTSLVFTVSDVNQSVPFTQFAIRIFPNEGDVVSFRDAIHHKHSIKTPKYTSLCSELNGEHVGECFVSIR